VSDTDTAPIEEDLRADDEEFIPAIEPKKSKAWLNLLQESEDAFEPYNTHCDNIDKAFANLQRLSNTVRDKEFQMFWANAEVIKPSIYAKPPVPVVVAKFMDRRPVYQAAAEFMERCAIVSFDLAGIDELMKLVRDDLALIDRGVAWCRYESAKESGQDTERVCIDFVNRRDFLHSISRNWPEVTWVAFAAYLTRTEARKRFSKHSGNAYQNAEYRVNKDAKEVGGADNRERAKFWEIWSKADNRVLWVAVGCEDVLDEDDPHLELRNFFPCPKPAYGTVQRGSLVPVPDVLQYKDQLDEINVCTAKIHALTEAVEAKGFYPAGGSELGDAVQAAIATNTPGRVLVPISNWAAFGGSKEVIIWLPIDMIAQTITALVALRKQIIDDIYQIMGLSDIMRGSTSPEETLGAQQLKSQYGSTRIRDKQQEMVRLARDLVEITCEIITEKFDDVTMVEMSQTQLPTNRMLEEKVAGMAQQLQGQHDQMMQMAQSPQGAQMAQSDPQQAQQMMQQGQQQIQQGLEAIKKVQAQPTVDQVLKFLKDQRSRAFVLDIETDSTIVPDENADKKSRTEFVGVLSQLLPQMAQMIAQEPKTAAFCGEILKFATAPFRAGRSMDGAIDELVEQMKAKADVPQGDDPTTAQNKTALQIEQMKVKQQSETDAAKLKQQQEEARMKDAQHDRKLQNDKEIAAMQMGAKQGDNQAKAEIQSQKLIENRETHEAAMQKSEQDRALAEQKGALAQQTHAMKASDMVNRQQERAAQQASRQAAQQFKINNSGGGMLP
jgi:hypothetical protein